MAEPTTTSLPRSRVIGYALGDVANNLAFMMTSLFLMSYMTDIAGLSAGLAGTIYAVTKVWAGVTDLTAGNTVDKFQTRWGRLRPWVLFGSAPLAIVLVGLFSTTNFVPAGSTQAVVWILIFDALFQLAYSFVNIPYGSLSAAMTQDPVDRSRLAGARSIAAAVTSVGLAAVLSPQFSNTSKPGIEFQFMIATIVLAVLAIVLYILCFLNTREVVPRSPGKSTFLGTLKMVGQNKPLLTLCIGAFFLLGAMFTMSAVAMYFAKFVLGSPAHFITLNVAQTVGTVLTAPFVPRITVKLGKRLGYVIMAGVIALGFVIIALTPMVGGGLPMALVAWFVYGVGGGGTNALMFSMQADTVDYGEWKTGTRAEGGSYSILSFVRKCGQGLGGALGGAVLGAFGYDAFIKATKTQAGVPFTQLENYQSVQTGIAVACGWLPAALAVIAALIIMFYPLKPEQHQALVGELIERRAQRAAQADGVTQQGTAVSVSQSGQLVADKPVITISEQYGCGASQVGRLVADRLAVPFTGSRFSSEELEALHLAEENSATQNSPANRFLRSLALSGTVDADASAAANAEADHETVMQNTHELLAAVENGGVVIGRDANRVLEGMQGAFHVRLTGERAVRIARACESWNLTAEQAAERLDREDEMRPAMSLRLMHYDQNDASYYDLVIDACECTVAEVAELVVSAYQASRSAE